MYLIVTNRTAIYIERGKKQDMGAFQTKLHCVKSELLCVKLSYNLFSNENVRDLETLDFGKLRCIVSDMPYFNTPLYPT